MPTRPPLELDRPGVHDLASPARASTTGCSRRSNESDVELETVDALSDWMFAFAQNHGGIYDGWGAPVILRKEP